MKDILYNPCFIEYKCPTGAVKISDDIFITIKITEQYHLSNLRIRVKDDNNRIFLEKEFECIAVTDGYQIYQVAFRIPVMGLFWYCFEFADIYGHHFIGANPELDGILTDRPPNCWQLTVGGEFIGKLDWFKGKTMYQIMVDRFYRGKDTPIRPDVVFHKNWLDTPEYRPIHGKILNNDFFGGNLSGITKKLDYLKSLSVGIIYLNPIFAAASNHKYDTGDYLKIDPMFGDENDFIELCKEAALRDIAIILDGVFNHTGDDSHYFNKYSHYPTLGAYQSLDSPYFSWYKFLNHPDYYESWWGIKTLPSVNQANSDFLAFIAGPDGVIDKWLRLGASGFRLDVIDELSDEFIELIYHRIKTVNPENVVIGEVWEDASNKVSYGRRRRYLYGKQVDSVMNYPLKNAIINYLNYHNLLGLKIKMRHLINNYPKHVLDCLMNHLGTHDTMRLLNNFAYSTPDSLSKSQQAHYRLREEEYYRAVRMLKMATALQFTLPGVPSLYYADETGSQGFRDPFCRNTFDWNRIDEDIYNWYRRLGEIRCDPAYKEGIYCEELTVKNVFAFSRHGIDYKIITVINNNNRDITISIISGIELLSGMKVEEYLTLPPKSARIIKTEKNINIVLNQ
ncbi:MAG: glycoside hydrolase family 13 protein [Bacilli bacterium]|nr:glycoside hydrolase family 13 protein [Bacilli bacterium]MDD4076765.1 glycoside hydrolase family 13 protein [Bacilli bacterium]MDD4388779.1 glycoside hydrolase family 13 protein [Bacilli bacterium]